MDLEQLSKLNELKNTGVISQEEFEQTKAKILAGENFSSGNVSATATTGPQTIIYNTNTQAAPEAATVYGGKSRIAYILLAWFLGFFGIHNFYAGYNGRGTIQLLITILIGWTIVPLGILCIWILIEMCTVDRDAYNYPMR